MASSDLIPNQVRPHLVSNNSSITLVYSGLRVWYAARPTWTWSTCPVAAIDCPVDVINYAQDCAPCAVAHSHTCVVSRRLSRRLLDRPHYTTLYSYMCYTSYYGLLIWISTRWKSSKCDSIRVPGATSAVWYTIAINWGYQCYNVLFAYVRFMTRKPLIFIN